MTLAQENNMLKVEQTDYITGIKEA
ncbi:hypothetical protein MARINOS108_90080 [Marinoscillum sp. 108]|nr:hypothetical protein MARINOS108_90080 [Marinoscillum sp. 108]